MKVLVACDAIAGLSPLDASEVLARSFAEAGARVAVVGLADGGSAFAAAVARLDGPEIIRPDSDHLDQVLASPRPGRWLLDLSTTRERDQLPEINAVPGWDDLVAIVPPMQDRLALTGLNGAVARTGRERGWDLADTLAAESAAGEFAGRLGIDPAAPGSGAGYGWGAAVLAAGGTVSSGVRYLAEAVDLVRTAAQADLIITGCPRLDDDEAGGVIVNHVVEVSQAQSCPVVVVTGRSFLSARQLRVLGIEQAYALLTGPDGIEPSPAQLQATADAVARTWRW
ncbi:MAG: glycerate kinase [Arachnia sp.]